MSCLNGVGALRNDGAGFMLRGMGDRFADEERAALLALLEDRPAMAGEPAGKTAWSTIASEVSRRGSALAVWQDLHPPTLDGMSDSDYRFTRAWKQLTEWAEPESGFDLVTVLDTNYPLPLREIHQMPPLLFVKGKLRADEVGVSVVGSRDATPRGRSIAAHVAEGLTGRGISVLSGLAAGIDGAVHEATLKAGGRPIGVIGTGIRRVYPASHRELHEQVAAAGALVSQFLPDAPPTKHSFPMRNIVMSGLGRASIIVEAGERSGTRIQARVAVEHGRPVILTDFVVNATKWGQALRHRPGVYVAGSTGEVMDIVEQVLDDNARDELEVLTPST
jgi:DNA processing protein